MRRSQSFVLLFGLCALCVVLGWAMTDVWSGSNADSVQLPPGDIENGRRAFLAQGCALCHAATGEEAFPPPASAANGPEIGGPQAAWEGPDIARAILEPSHDVPPEFSDARTGEEEEPESPMAHYADALTVQDVADLVAYVRYLGE